MPGDAPGLGSSAMMRAENARENRILAREKRTQGGLAPCHRHLAFRNATGGVASPAPAANADAAPRTSRPAQEETIGREMHLRRLHADLRGVGLLEAGQQEDPARAFPTLAAARGWRTDAAKQVKDRDAPRAVLADAPAKRSPSGSPVWRAGSILNKRQEAYKPAVVRGYRRLPPRSGFCSRRSVTGVSSCDRPRRPTGTRGSRLQGEGCSERA